MRIATSELKAALIKVETALPNKPNIAITAGVLCEVDGGTMTVTATDLENTIRAKCKVEGEDKGLFVVPGKQFVDLVKGLTAETVETKIEEGRLILRAGKSVYKFPTMDANEFPQLPEIKKEFVVNFKSAELTSCLQSVAFCVDKDEPRPHFRGVLVDVLGDKVVFVGTDTKTLAVNSLDIKSLGSIKALLPIKTVVIVSKLLAGGDISVYLSDKTLSIKGADFELVSQLLAGVEDFPDYSKVIPSKEMENATAGIAELKKTIERLTVFLTDRYNKLTFLFTQGKLELSVNNPERGEAKEEIAVGYAGKDQKLAFNPAIREFINRAGGDTITMGIKDGKSPMLMFGKDANWKYVAMPLRVEE